MEKAKFFGFGRLVSLFYYPYGRIDNTHISLTHSLYLHTYINTYKTTTTTTTTKTSFCRPFTSYFMCQKFLCLFFLLLLLLLLLLYIYIFLFVCFNHIFKPIIKRKSRSFLTPTSQPPKVRARLLMLLLYVMYFYVEYRKRTTIS